MSVSFFMSLSLSLSLSLYIIIYTTEARFCFCLLQKKLQQRKQQLQTLLELHEETAMERVSQHHVSPLLLLLLLLLLFASCLLLRVGPPRLQLMHACNRCMHAEDACMQQSRVFDVFLKEQQPQFLPYQVQEQQQQQATAAATSSSSSKQQEQAAAAKNSSRCLFLLLLQHRGAADVVWYWSRH